MGLRIATDITALVALQHLRSASQAFQTASERIASGKRINSAADDPTGSFLAARFKAQVASLNQASTNIQVAKNFIDTADGGLSQISTQLTTIRALILEARSDTSKTAVNQTSIDTALDAINRIANSTGFGTKLLLNGLAGYATSSVDSAIAQLSLRRVFFDSGSSARSFSVSISAAAEAGTLALGTFASGGKLTVTGNLGTSTVTVASGASVSDVETSINAVRDFTGVFASGGSVFTEDFGSSERVTVAVASGTGYSGTAGSDTGADIAGTIDGQSATGDGRTLRVNTAVLSADVTFSAVSAGSSLSFGVLDTGNQFSIGAVGNGNDLLRFGIDGVTDSQLGSTPLVVKDEAVGGRLSSIESGGANSLSGDIGNALRIVDEAIDQISAQRAFLGTLSANTLTPQSNAISTAITKITAARSVIEDADIALETINQSVALNLFNSAKTVLAQSNALSNSILDLLTPISRIG